MSTSLLIVESPAKCKKIQDFLGPGWRVIATFGHIRALQQDLDAVGLDRDFEPKYEFLSKDKAKAIKQLKDESKGVKEIYLASDDDREGEAISYSVAVLLGLDVRTAKRAVFHEITKPAILRAVQNPRTIDMNRVNAQQARSILDMMVGFTISQLLWSYVGNALSAGRCQTPALRIICEREREIDGFTSQRAWKLGGEWITNGLTMDAKLLDELEDEESARNFLENIHSEVDGTVQSSITKGWTQAPPKPLITSTLQQEASSRYGCNTKRTMQIAQRLYEAGHITYMRTDHAALSEEAIEKAQELVKQLYGDAFVLGGLTKEKEKVKEKGKEKAKDKAKESDSTAQEAHEAIRPTHFELAELPTDEDWNAVDRKVYTLIRNRAIQSVMTSAKGEEHSVQFTADGDPSEFPWIASWKRTTFQGWKRIGFAEANLDSHEQDEPTEKELEAETWKKAIAISPTSKIKWKSLEAFPTDTRAAPRFNEATLVRELEKKGIGRPSTFASLVNTIQEKEYVKREDKPAKEVTLLHLSLSKAGQWPPSEEQTVKKMGGEKDKLVPTSLGYRILDFCLQEFSTLFTYSFTSQMEQRLDRIAEGTEPWKQLCRDTWNSYQEKYTELKKAGNKTTTKNSRMHEFGNGLKAVLGKSGPLVLQEDESGDKAKTKFLGWVDGVAFEDMTEEMAKKLLEQDTTKRQSESASLGSWNGDEVLVKTGPYGKYAQCGSVRIPFQDGDTFETLTAKMKTKQDAVVHSLGDFEFRTGQYGMFMFKKSVAKGKKPQFVGLPEGLNPKQLTEEAAIKIYQTGLQQKARTRNFSQSESGEGGTGTRGKRGGFRGGFRGRGRS
jgi:DNA topoisomerase-1